MQMNFKDFLLKQYFLQLFRRCMSGYTGYFCKNKCFYPSFGENCKYKCECPALVCHHKTGCLTGNSLDFYFKRRKQKSNLLVMI